ncbi:SCO-spondin-like isoform X3 [Prinia subflava]|uniref:SCO-spondin-like isoform X3 n=1 Tax=Prinia subflava TaxID=208062 RepID=UPI002FE0BB29
MKSLPCRGAEGRWSRRERALSPRPARGRCGTAGAPTGTAPAPHPARQSRHPGASQAPGAVRGSQAPGAMRVALLWAGWLLAAACLACATGSCRHRCCPGRNNACWAPGARRARCYCDSYCQRTGDCCQDYLATCRRAAVGCAVGPWGPWSGCSSRCGAGSRARSRQVTVPPRHGGDPCPDLKQRRGCLGQHPTCGTAKAALLPEVAKIVPRAFSQDFRDPWRRAGLPLPEPSGWEPRAAGTPGAAGCAGASGCVCSAGGTRPAAAPTAPGTGCQEPGHFGWLLLWWGAKARGCRRACRRAVSAPNQLSSSCRIPLGRFAAHPWCQLPLFSIKYFAEE